jgi:hypothetical protein
LKAGRSCKNNFIEYILESEMSPQIEWTSFLIYLFILTWVLKINTPSIRNRVLGLLKRKNIKICFI